MAQLQRASMLWMRSSTRLSWPAARRMQQIVRQHTVARRVCLVSLQQVEIARWRHVATWHQSLGSRALATQSSASYYELLGVAPSATSAEIKRAYLQEAKKWHPDINKAPDAGERFKRLANAYDTLRDPTRRASYDDSLRYGQRQAGGSGYSQGSYSQSASSQQSYRSTGGPSSGGGSQHEPSLQDINAFELFRSVLEEIGIEQLATYLQNFRDEANHAAAAAKAGDLQPARAFAWRHKVFASSIVLPLALALRFPGAIVAVLRFASAILTTLLAASLRDPRLFGLLMPLRRYLYYKWRVVAMRAAARTREKRGK